MSGGVVDVRYSCVEGWSGALGGVGNFGLPPKLDAPLGPDGVIGTLDDTLALSSLSPCIDAGNNELFPADLADLDLDGDLREKLLVDLCDLARFVDDPAVQDTGKGHAPIGDIGAYEFQYCQPSLGFQGPGLATLTVCGAPLTAAGSQGELIVHQGPALGVAVVFVSTQLLPTPLFDGTLVALPPVTGTPVPVPLDDIGRFSMKVPGGSGPIVDVYVQAVLPFGDVGWLTNAVLVSLGHLSDRFRGER